MTVYSSPFSISISDATLSTTKLFLYLFLSFNFSLIFVRCSPLFFFFFFNDTPPPEISPLPPHAPLPICRVTQPPHGNPPPGDAGKKFPQRSPPFWTRHRRAPLGRLSQHQVDLRLGKTPQLSRH